MRTPGRFREKFLSSPLHVVVFFAIFGPPFGGLIVVGTWVAVAFFNGGIDAIGAAVGMSILIVFFSYFFGGIQAIFVGIILAFLSWPYGKFTYIQAILVSAFVGLVAAIALVLHSSAPFEVASLMTGIGIFAAVSVRKIFAKRFGVGSGE